MKNILLTLIFIATFYSCKAQTVYPLETPAEERHGNNYYVKDTQNVHDTIVGVWLWENGNSSFELTLQEFEQNPLTEGSTIYRDDIYGKYKYIENGNVIAEVTEIPNLIQNKPKVGVLYRNSDTFFIQISDVISKKYKQGEFILNDDGTATMTLEDPIGTNGLYFPDNPPTGLDFQLPTNITLTKME